MTKVFFVFAIVYLSKATKEKRMYVGACTYEHWDDAYKAMIHQQSRMRKDGLFIYKSDVFRKVVKL